MQGVHDEPPTRCRAAWPTAGRGSRPCRRARPTCSANRGSTPSAIVATSARIAVTTSVTASTRVTWASKAPTRADRPTVRSASGLPPGVRPPGRASGAGALVVRDKPELQGWGLTCDNTRTYSVHVSPSRGLHTSHDLPASRCTGEPLADAQSERRTADLERWNRLGRRRSTGSSAPAGRRVPRCRRMVRPSPARASPDQPRLLLGNGSRTEPPDRCR
jgi:hypothetical protein